MTFHIIGGGPSIADLDVKSLTGKIIACNNAGLDIAPDADALIVMDGRWIEWNKDRLHENCSKTRICTQKPTDVDLSEHGFQLYEREKYAPVSQVWARLAGKCSGAMAINLAYLFGATEIILHGFEMRAVGNYHDDHRNLKGEQVVTPANLYEEEFIPSILNMVAAIAPCCRVVNATPDSALKLPAHA